ncbi:hypothetical protein GCM10027215_17700 [Nocardioides zeae]
MRGVQTMRALVIGGPVTVTSRRYSAGTGSPWMKYRVCCTTNRLVPPDAAKAGAAATTLTAGTAHAAVRTTVRRVARAAGTGEVVMGGSLGRTTFG